MEGRRADSGARRFHRAHPDHGRRQDAGRGDPRGEGRRRHLPVVRRGRPPRLRPPHPEPASRNAPDGHPRAGGTGRGVHAVELPGGHPGPQDGGCSRRGLLVHPQALGRNPWNRGRHDPRPARGGPAPGRAEPRVRGAVRSFRAPRSLSAGAQGDVHRLHPRRQALGPSRRGRHEAHHHGARRTRAGRGLRRRGRGQGGHRRGQRQVPQRRPGVRLSDPLLRAREGLREVREEVHRDRIRHEARQRSRRDGRYGAAGQRSARCRDRRTRERCPRMRRRRDHRRRTGRQPGLLLLAHGARGRAGQCPHDVRGTVRDRSRRCSRGRISTK